jgi:hypothetical protein
VLDGGIEVPHSKDVLPDEKRLSGDHLSDAPVAQFKKVQTTIKGAA